jgi:hypothetical protein
LLLGCAPMPRRFDQLLKTPTRSRNSAVPSARKFGTLGKRARIGSADLKGPYLPPERWYEPSEQPRGRYAVIVESAGAGYRHVLTADDVRQRLAQLPAWMTRSLDVVQLSRMTRKKRRSPCYGMQWGSTIYLYPIEDSLIESFVSPPKPAQRIEAAMYGAHWSHAEGQWRLHWSEQAIRDFYLNNVLIHELGHILDSRNTSHRDRERFAEWFALEVGYKASRRSELAEKTVAKYVTRRHGRS